MAEANDKKLVLPAPLGPKGQIWRCVPMLALCVFLSCISAMLSLFPGDIYIQEKGEHNIRLNLPLQAVIEPETVSVLQINNEPVKDNITVTLDQPLQISAGEAGTASMTMKAFGVPVKKIKIDVLPDTQVIPCGLAVGVRIHTDGVMVLGTGLIKDANGKSINPSEGKLKSGDLILKADGKPLSTKEDLKAAVAASKSELTLTIKRNNETFESIVAPQAMKGSNEKKIGLWVRDSTQGIGTVTYVNPRSGLFGALGHGILDIDTKQLMTVNSGKIMESNITTIKKGGKGMPGELVGDIQPEKVLGTVKANNACGVFGAADLPAFTRFAQKKYGVAFQDEIHEGPAKILSNLDKSEIKAYDVYVENVNRYSAEDSKGMIIRITDPALLSRTSGIVQGMSGSPILQNDKLIGAVTHVFVQDPTKGYGIFIENMLKQEARIKP